METWNRTVEGGGVEESEEVRTCSLQIGGEDGKQTPERGFLRETAEQLQRGAERKRFGVAAREEMGKRGNWKTVARWMMERRSSLALKEVASSSSLSKILEMKEEESPHQHVLSRH